MKIKIKAFIAGISIFLASILLILIASDNLGSRGVAASDSTVILKDSYNYYSDVFGLPNENNFITLTYGSLINLISSNAGEGKDAQIPYDSKHKPQGDYIILFGGSWDTNTVFAAKIIDEYSRKYNVPVYVFDPLLDAGLGEQIAGVIGPDANDEANIGKSGYTYLNQDYLYDNFHIKNYYYQGYSLLERINRSFYQEELVSEGNELITPLLISVNRRQESKSTRIRSRVEYPFEEEKISQELLRQYKTAVESLFYSADKSTALYDPFIALSSESVNAGYTNTYLTENHYFKAITFGQLNALLNSDGEKIILFGSAHSESSQALFVPIQSAAQSQDFKGSIYLFDPVLANVPGAPSIISSQSPAQNLPLKNAGTHSLLYTYILDNYMSGFVSRWNKTGSITKAAVALTGTDEKVEVKDKLYTKQAEANLIIYNKAIKTDKQSGLIESYESELSYLYDSGKSWSGTHENMKSGSNLNKDSLAYKLNTAALKDFFSKAGLSDAFNQSGYSIEIKLNALDDRSVFSVSKKNSKLVMYTFYAAQDADRQVKEFELTSIYAQRLSPLTHYFVASKEAHEIIEKVKDGTIYSQGIVLNKAGYDLSATGTSQGTKPTAPGSEDGGKNEETPPENNEEIC